MTGPRLTFCFSIWKCHVGVKRPKDEKKNLLGDYLTGEIWQPELLLLKRHLAETPVFENEWEQQ